MSKKTIHKDLFKQYAETVKSHTGINIFENTRKQGCVLARAVVVNVIRKEYPDTTFHKIKKLFRDNGKNYDHATALHAVKTYDTYNNPKYGMSYEKQQVLLNGYTLTDLTYKLNKGLMIKQEIKDHIDNSSINELKKLKKCLKVNI